MTDDEAPRSVPGEKPPQFPSAHVHGRRRLLFGAVLSFIGALILGAGVGGWWLANKTLVASHAGAPVAIPSTATDPVVSTVQMPDVRGLDEASAQQVLADSAIPVDAISTHDAPSVATPGTVVEQSPAFGARDVTTVDLGIAVPVTMPDLVGTSQDEAVRILSSYGTGVSVTYGYSKAATAGTVLSMTPAAGKPLGQDASIKIATSGSTLPLTQLRPIAGGCGSDSNVAINGHDFATALACSTATGRATDTTWVLSKTVDRFTATVGIADSGTPGASASYRVLLDGRVVAKGTASYGGAASIDVSCTGAIQLTISVGPTSAGEDRVAFGDAVVYGSDAGIARLATLR